MDRVMEELPPGWVKTTLGKVLEFKYGKSLPAKRRNNVGYPVYGSNGEVGHNSLPLTQGPTLIIGRKGSIGKVHLSMGKCWPIDTTYYIDCFHGQPPQFWRHLLRPLDLADLDRATALPGLNRNDAYKSPVNLPPLKEQERIVARFEKLLACSRRAREALETVPDLLDQLRQSVLAAAFRGDLTSKWREEHPDVESASELLKRIRVEHRKRWEEAELERLKAKGLTGERLDSEFAKRRKQHKEPAPMDITDLPQLPRGWCWARISELGDVQLGRQRAPKYHSGKNMRPYLRVQNVFEDRLDLSDVMEMEFSPDDYERYYLASGDILLNEGQSLELVGRPAMYRGEIPGACFTNTLIRFRPFHPIAPEYPLLVFIHYLHTGRFRKEATISTNIAHLGAARFADIEFPLPPKDEQQHMVEQIQASIRQVRRLSGIGANIERELGRLDESILSKAFRGELVPQDPKDEPAPELLERIRAERARKATKDG